MTEEIIGARPPRVLICDADYAMAQKLQRELNKNSLVDHLTLAHSIQEAHEAVDSEVLDIVFLGLLSFDLRQSSDFLFATRREHAGVVFALYVDRAAYEQAAVSFDGDLKRLSHYYLLNRTLDGLCFAQELRQVLILCLMDLGISTRE